MFGKNKSESMITLLSEETVLTGTLKTANRLDVFGKIEVSDGSVAIESTSKVRIASCASIKGNIIATDVLIEGTVTGNITSSGKVTLSKGSTLLGDIVARSLSFEEEVKFTGGVKIEQVEGSELLLRVVS
jgi:cytoskeletal protein CcmA (bactofilin family)